MGNGCSRAVAQGKQEFLRSSKKQNTYQLRCSTVIDRHKGKNGQAAVALA